MCCPYTHKNYKHVAAILNVKVKTKHELDAYICCLTGKLFIERKTENVGDVEGKIIIPKQQ